MTGDDLIFGDCQQLQCFTHLLYRVCTPIPLTMCPLLIFATDHDVINFHHILRYLLAIDQVVLIGSLFCFLQVCHNARFQVSIDQSPSSNVKVNFDKPTQIHE